jgi:hypothetical protein
MDIATLFKTGTSAITFAEKFMEVVEKSKSEEGTNNFTGIVNSLKIVAIDMCGDISKELRSMNVELRQSGIDTTKSIEQLYNDLKWVNFITKSKIRRYEKKFHEIYQMLSIFMDDVEAVLICTNQTQKLTEPFMKAYEKKKRLDELVNSNFPIEKNHGRNVADQRIYLLAIKRW